MCIFLRKNFFFGIALRSVLCLTLLQYIHSENKENVFPINLAAYLEFFILIFIIR